MNRIVASNTKRIYWVLIFIFIISISLFSTFAFGGKIMEPLYNLKELASLEPQTYKINSRNISLFPVPQVDSVGTNDMNNAITQISFPKGKISYDKYFKNAVDDIGGGGIYLPVISPDLIGFGQVRSFVLFDFKKKIHREFRIEMAIEKYIEKIAIADARQRHFIFEIEAQKRGASDPFDVNKSLKLIDISGEKPKLLKEISKDIGVVWSVVGDKNLLHDLEKRQVMVLNMDLEPANHPLADEIKRNKDNLSFSKIHAHPYLPFAILCGGKRGSTFVSWNEGRDKAPHPLIDFTIQFSYSPDGKWVVFQKDFPEPKRTYLMPVSEKYPHYLGSPIQLSNYSFSENKAAWTTNPVSFVGSRLDSLYRWDLENRDYPGKGKMSFHDYIVEKDLEKLTKEKRQGLGEKRK